MSLNIQTSTGLLEIGGKVTKEKITEALGYEPADKEIETTVDNHTKDTNIHITSEERTLWNKEIENLDAHKSDKTVHVTSEEKQTWNNKSDFSGAYTDLIDAPNITETESGNLVIADESGNIIMQVDENGVATTNVAAKTINLDGEDLGVRLDELEATSLPNILDNESGDLTIADDSGNAIMKVNASGLETTTVTAKSAVIGGVDITTKLDEHKESINSVSGDLSDHTSNSTVHITADERVLWNNKSDFSGDYNDLTNAPDIKEDNSGEVVYADEQGNVILKIGETGLETTQVIANTVLVNGSNVGSHIGDKNIHITSAERESWNSKVDATYVDTAVANLVDSSPATLDTLNELASALGDDPNFATTVSNQIGLKANQTDLDSHVSNKSNPHNVTKSQVGLGNVDNTSDVDKPVSTAQQEALNSLKTELSETIVSESKEWIVADESGNIIARVDSDGLETTTVTAKAVVVNGVDVGTALAGKANISHTHDQYLEADDISNLATTAYVDEELSKKADSNHTHEQYLVADDIASLATIEYVDTELDKKANSSHTHDEYLVESDISGLATTDYVNEQLALKADVNHIHEQYLVADDIVNKADTLYVNEQLATKANTVHTHTEYLTNDDISSLASEEYVTTKIAEAKLAASDVDLSGYYTKSETDAKIEGAIDAIEHPIVDLTPYATTEYVTEQLSTKADTTHTHEEYLTADDIANKTDKSYVDGQLATKADGNHTHDEYLVANDISGKADKTYVDTELSKKADGNHTHDEYLTNIPDEYITEEELNAKGYLTAHQDLSDYAKKSDVPEVIDNLTSSSTTAALSAAQGAALKTAIDSITGDIGELGGGDMMKATYDTNNNGIVDNAEKLEGHAADYFAIADHIHDEYLVESDISNLELITVTDIDRICGVST